VEGTVGTHIKLLVRNASKSHTALYMVNRTYQIALTDAETFKKQCSDRTKCFSVDNYQLDQTNIPQQGDFFISFIWSFPPLPANSNYYAVLIYQDQHEGQTEHLIHSLLDKYTYTLRSTKPPCITVLVESAPNTTECPSLRPSGFTAGSTIYFHGANWISGESKDGVKQEIDITLSCASSCQGSSQPQPISVSEQPGQSIFDQRYTLPTLPGTYQITATNRVADKTVSLADGALTFSLPAGSPINVVQPCIHITVINGQQPTPTPLPNCQQQEQSTTITAGSTILIQGMNWFLPQKDRVAISAVCTTCRDSTNKQSAFTPFSATVQTNGHFQQSVKISPAISGTYALIIKAENTTFFSDKSPESYNLSISSGSTDNPAILPLLALLPALVSLLLYIIMQRQRTVQAAATTRRSPGGPVPTILRASLPPPVTRQRPGGPR
jgi:hypothetical protein